MRFLFNKEIDGWDSWGKVFCDLKAFTPLAGAIFEKERLGAACLTSLTPGSNAVFRAKDFVLKLFAPAESGVGGEDDQIELKAHQSAEKNGVRVPAIVAHGAIQDRYLFRYIVMEYIDGKEAMALLPAFSKAQKTDFAHQMLSLLEKLHQSNGTVLPKIDVIDRAVNNPRLQKLPPRLASDMKALALSVGMDGAVLTHGDITKENVLICPDGSIVLIDFADSVFAPPLYELAPIAFDLFGFDRDFLDPFMGHRPIGQWLDSLMASVAIHDFGAAIVFDYAKRNQIPAESIRSLGALRRYILAHYT